MWLVGGGWPDCDLWTSGKKRYAKIEGEGVPRGRNGHGKVLRQRQACSRNKQKVRGQGRWWGSQGAGVCNHNWEAGLRAVESVPRDEDTDHPHLIPIPSSGTTQKEPHSCGGRSASQRQPTGSPSPDLQAGQSKFSAFLIGIQRHLQPPRAESHKPKTCKKSG